MSNIINITSRIINTIFIIILFFILLSLSKVDVVVLSKVDVVVLSKVDVDVVVLSHSDR